MNKIEQDKVKSVLRGHHCDKEKWPYKTGDLLKEVQFIWNFLWQEKGDLLIQMTAWTGLTVALYSQNGMLCRQVYAIVKC